MKICYKCGSRFYRDGACAGKLDGKTYYHCPVCNQNIELDLCKDISIEEVMV